jgi:hypothetical protein
MEIVNENQRLDLVHRAIAFGLAVVTTGIVATSVAVVFTGNTHSVGAALGRVALAPLRAIIGG